ncbi:MAG: glutaredoxin family protein [Stenotrophomonas sp.]
MRLQLYQRDDCHLCDQALAVLAAVRTPQFDSVFIDGQPALEAAWGSRVPVLVAAGGQALEWPFDPPRLRAWLQALPAGSAD